MQPHAIPAAHACPSLAGVIPSRPAGALVSVVVDALGQHDEVGLSGNPVNVQRLLPRHTCKKRGRQQCSAARVTSLPAAKRVEGPALQLPQAERVHRHHGCCAPTANKTPCVAAATRSRLLPAYTKSRPPKVRLPTSQGSTSTLTSAGRSGGSSNRLGAVTQSRLVPAAGAAARASRWRPTAASLRTRVGELHAERVALEGGEREGCARSGGGGGRCRSGGRCRGRGGVCLGRLGSDIAPSVDPASKDQAR